MNIQEDEKVRLIVERNNTIRFRRGAILWSSKLNAWVLPGGNTTTKVSMAKEAAEYIEAMHAQHENKSTIVVRTCQAKSYSAFN